MKLATYRDGSRDGQLVVVSRDLRSAHYATSAAHTLLQALDDWNFIGPQLHDLYVALNQGRARHAFAFDPSRCLAPLPRAFQWLVADVEPAGSPAALPSLRQGSGAALAGPMDDMIVSDEALEPDCMPGLAVITGDLPLLAEPGQALDSIRLLMLCNDWCLRALHGAAEGAERSSIQARPATAFGPVALTPDELGPIWARGRLEATIEIRHQGSSSGSWETGSSRWDFGHLIAQACRTRALPAGSVLGIGLDAAAPGRPARLIRSQLRWGDRVRVEARGHGGQSLFGAIEQILAEPD
jgi:fumarylacetoacetate (FAA) hydrolase